MYKMQIMGNRPPERQNGPPPWYRVFVALVLVAAKAIPLVPRMSIMPRRKCDIKGGQCESYDI